MSAARASMPGMGAPQPSKLTGEAWAAENGLEQAVFARALHLEMRGFARQIRSTYQVWDARPGKGLQATIGTSTLYGGWTVWDGDERFTAGDPLDCFRWWVGRHSSR